MQAAPQSPGMPICSGSYWAAPGLPPWPGEVQQSWGSGEVLHELHANVHSLITSWCAFIMFAHHKALTLLPRFLCSLCQTNHCCTKNLGYLQQFKAFACYELPGDTQWAMLGLQLRFLCWWDPCLALKDGCKH